ncbi:transglutaminase-like cysteine peptidase [Sphingomonas sp. LY29]|uniref:transglutaminase-like cysteine peptidase n=1 Tax=Sphingomonas sp. LY29 TaxID=3095341 RepID=UPI002D77EDE8|nr:transglutaminase-like cysteine peptidase [Sphingomonas sp. LY29]WRP26981.1 transglutaminase-like cysteine peptidase [Sphingomonas sp. LY29]
MAKASLRNARRWIAGIVPAAALLVPVAAAAQIAPPTRSMSKTEAILGGGSALGAILAQQSAQPTRLAMASTPTLPYYRPAIQRFAPAPVSTDQPDVFNSVALSIGGSPLDRRWDAVARRGIGGEAGAFAASLRSSDETQRIEAINAYVNARVRFVDDRVQFGVGDRWMAASETLSRGRGDCEDYAIAKRALLRAAGLADKDLYLVVLKDTLRRADHAVLVVRSEGRFLVLDNGTDRIVDSSAMSDYRPVLTFTEARTYTHGYRRNAMPPVTYASYEPQTPIAIADARFEPASGDRDLPEVVRTSVSLVPAPTPFTI